MPNKKRMGVIGEDMRALGANENVVIDSRGAD